MTSPPDDLVSALEADLAALAAADADLERDAEVAERTRIERSSVTLSDRLRGASERVGLLTRGGAHPSGTVEVVGDGWALVVSARAESIVVLGSVLSVTGLGRAVHAPGPFGERTLASVLRTWCRDRSTVSVRLVDGSTVQGLASASYADHIEVATECGVNVTVPVVAIAVVTR
jgi:hypothetical protein